MHGSKLPYRTWLLAIHAFVDHPKGVSALQSHRYLGVTRKTAWFLNHRIREGLDLEEVDMEGELECFVGPVEIDETYIGGKARNMHHAARQRNRQKHEYGKAIVVGLRDRKTRRVRVLVITRANRKRLHRFIYDRTFTDTQVYTDDAKAYKKLKRPHKAVNHSKWQFADGDCSTNGIESFWAIVKRGYKGTYHSWSHKHIQRYLNEFVSRHNMLHLGTRDQMKAVAKGMIGKRLLYRELTGQS